MNNPYPCSIDNLSIATPSTANGYVVSGEFAKTSMSQTTFLSNADPVSSSTIAQEQSCRICSDRATGKHYGWSLFHWIFVITVFILILFC